MSFYAGFCLLAGWRLPPTFVLAGGDLRVVGQEAREVVVVVGDESEEHDVP